MEVHKHPHHVTHKKKWGEYLLEFFMLFLAVFLGFVAENIRENVSDNSREREYMLSMKEDLSKDTAMLNVARQRALSVVANIDTTLTILQNQKLDTASLTILYRVNLKTLAYVGAAFTDRTTAQLKNAGAMRMIRNKTVAGSLLNYWSKIGDIKYISDLIDRYRENAREESYALFDQKYYVGKTSPQLMTTDNFKLTVFANRLSHIKNIILNTYLPPIAEQKQNAKTLMDIIGKNY